MAQSELIKRAEYFIEGQLMDFLESSKMPTGKRMAFSLGQAVEIVGGLVDAAKKSQAPLVAADPEGE